MPHLIFADNVSLDTRRSETSNPNISVCIATFRRGERLDHLLNDLAAQNLLPDQVVVVDNDAGGSAFPIIERHRGIGAPFTIDYAVQPQRGIALTRNKTVAMARGAWLAFIDDDERAPPDWLRLIMQAAERYPADGILAPVVPQVPADAPLWIRRGRFYDFARMPSGTEVPLNCMRFGNALLRGEPVRAQPGPFDPEYGLATGEDADLLIRMARAGARICWCDEAIVYEPIESARLSLSWLLLRALSGGQEFARKTLRGAYGKVSLFTYIGLFMRSLAQALIAICLSAMCWPVARHRAAAWMIRLSANVGKISVFCGWRYREYARM